ncbi:MAG: hypothetical protein ACI8PZ_003136 [Myxococcota bacterium]|jgi:hypothetical protein
MSVAEVRAWLRDTVVGLDLCPFARRPLEAGRVRFSVSTTEGHRGALEDVAREADLLVADPAIDTTLLLIPQAPADFETFVAWTEDAEDLLAEDDLQVVAFHPAFRFADADPHDPANGVNRSPVPLWHVLRADQVEAAVASHPDIASVPERNAALLRAQAEARR